MEEKPSRKTPQKAIGNNKTVGNKKAQPLPLTPNEKGVLDYIEFYLEQTSVAPTFRDIKDHFGFASFNSVQRYLKQLQIKGYIHMPGGNQKRAIVILRPANALTQSLQTLKSGLTAMNSPRMENSLSELGATTNPPEPMALVEALSLPLLGRVAAGRPIEAYEHDTMTTVPRELVRNPKSAFALRVQGESMIGEGIMDGDIIMVQKQATAENGDLVVANVNNEATVKRYYLYPSGFPNSVSSNVRSIDGPVIELRPSNPSLESMWYPARNVLIEGIVTGLVRKF